MDIRAQITLIDRATAPLQRIIGGIDRMTTSARAAQSAIDGTDPAALHRIRNGAQGAAAGLGDIERKARDIKPPIDDVTRSTNAFGMAIKGAVAGWLGFQGISKIIQLSDSLAATRSRINMINDGLQTTAELQDKIYQAAQRSKAKYADISDMVAKLSMNARDVFGKNDEAIQFAENLSKLFRIAGTDATGTASAMYNLTQALSTGVLRGQDLNAVLANAPNIVQIIADHMGVTIGQVRALAAEGKISGEAVKNAILGATQSINDQFAQIPQTWGGVLTQLANSALKAFEPALVAISAMAQYLPAIAPYIMGIVTAYGAWQIATAAVNVANMILNGTLKANPLMWIVMLIGLVIGYIYSWIASVGGITIAWEMAKYRLMAIWYGIVDGWNWLYLQCLKISRALAIGLNHVGNGIVLGISWMKSQVLQLVQSLVNGVIDAVNWLIKAVNKIPFVSIDTIERVSFGTRAAIKHEAAKQAAEARMESVKAQWDKMIGDEQAHMDSVKAEHESKLGEMQRNIDRMRAEKQEAAKMAENYKNMPNVGATGGGELSGIGGNTGRIAANTDKIKDTLNATTEELAYIRDLAEQEIINRFTTASISVEMKNDMQIASGMDIDGVIDHLSAGLEEQLRVVAEGVY